VVVIAALCLYLVAGGVTLFVLEHAWGPAPMIAAGGRNALLFALAIVGVWPVWVAMALWAEAVGPGGPDDE